jgi:sugar lactone lactonase YvrE
MRRKRTVQKHRALRSDVQTDTSNFSHPSGCFQSASLERQEERTRKPGDVKFPQWSAVVSVVSCLLPALAILAMPFGAFSQVGAAPNATTVGTGGLFLFDPQGVAVDGSGNLFIADSNNNRIIKVNFGSVPCLPPTTTSSGSGCTPASPSGGSATVVAGLIQSGYSGDGGLATNAQLSFPNAVAVDSAGNIFVADTNNNRIRMFTAGGNISTVAGNGTAGSAGDGGLATKAQLNRPTGVAVDSAGYIYIVDNASARIRRFLPGGNISTVAGTGTLGFSGDGGLATSATLSFPYGIAVDLLGNIYISDNFNRVRKFTVGGNILTVAGGAPCCNLGDGGPATAASMSNTSGVAVDSSGNLYIADTNDGSIRMVSAKTGIITTVLGSQFSFNLNAPRGVAVDGHGNLYVADTNNSRIQLVSASKGSVNVGSGSGAPGSTVQVPLTLSLNTGVSIDSLGVTVQVFGVFPPSGNVTFTPAAGISPASVFSATGTSLVLAWSDNLSSGAQPTVSGTVQLGTIGVSIPAFAFVGSQIVVSITQVGGDVTGATGTLTAVPLQFGPAATITTQTCSYLVGDVYPVGIPITTTQCGQFGDGQFSVLTFEDVLLALRVWAQLPGYTVPPCTDLFDALDADPPDSPFTVGGDGVLTLQDVQVTLQRWANLDFSRWTRPAGSYLRFPACSSPHSPQISSPQISTLRSNLEERQPETARTTAPGAVILGAAEVRGSVMRVPLYLRAPRPLTSLGISLGWAGPTAAKLTFSNGEMGAPAALDTQVPGVVTVAWLKNLPVTAGHRALLGYLEWSLADGAAPDRLRVYRVEANGVGLGPVRMELFGDQLQ